MWAFVVTPGNDEPKFAPVAGGSRGPRAATRVSDRGRRQTTCDKTPRAPKRKAQDINRQARYFEEDEGLAAVMTVARKSRGDAPAAGCDPAPHCRHGPPLFKQRAWTTWPHGKASSNSREAKTHLPHLAQASETLRAGSSPTVFGDTSYGAGFASAGQTCTKGGSREQARPFGARMHWWHFIQ